MFDFGISIQNFVLPLLNLFTKIGFAPFLAFVILAIAVVEALRIYIKYVFSAKIALKNAVKILSDIKDPTDFAAKFNEIDTAVSSVLCIKHSWSEFKETLIRPDDHISIYRNAIRPLYFININQVEPQLRLKRLHFFSNLLIGIGLLLTFIGLVAALTEAGKAIGDGGDDQESIRNLLSVAAFKFWTSVSGLGSSILLRIFYENQNTHIKNLLNKINSGLERGLQFVSSEYIAVEQLHEAREQSAAMKRFSTELAVSMAKEIQPVFASALAPIHESLKDIGGGIGDAIKDAAGAEMHELSSNLGGIVHSLSNLKSEMDTVAITIGTAMTEAAEKLRASAGTASSEMTQQLHDVISILAEENRKQASTFDEALKKLFVVVDHASTEASEEITNAAQSLATGMNGVSDGIRDAAGAMVERINQLSSALKIIEEHMNRHVQTMKSLTSRASDTERAMSTTSKHLIEAATPVTQASDRMAATAENLNQSVHGIRQVITDTHQNIVILSQKMTETQNTLQSSWRSYNERFGQVDENLARVLQEIVQHVNNSIGSLSTFVGEMDKNLGDAVKSFAQNIAELNSTAEDFEEASSKLATSVNKITEMKS